MAELKIRPTAGQRPSCTGEGADGDHCCYQAGVRCVYLRENIAGRRYACGVFLMYGSWEEMNKSPEYAPIGRFWERTGSPFNYCEVFDPSFCCRPEFRMGRNNDRDN